MSTWQSGFFASTAPRWTRDNASLTLNSIQALRAWISPGDCFPVGPLLRGSRKGGELTDAGVSERAIAERVRVLGESVGVTRLSAHDCRHYWATPLHSRGRIALRCKRRVVGPRWQCQDDMLKTRRPRMRV